MTVSSLIVGVGLGTESTATLRTAAVEREATVHEIGDALVVSSGPSTAVRVDATPDSVTAVFGCGVPGTAPAAVAATLLDDADDDLVAVRVDAEGVIVATGRGHHQLVHRGAPDGGDLVATSPADCRDLVTGAVEIDRSYEDFALGYGFHPEGRTPYEGIVALAGGRRFRVAEGIQDEGPTDRLTEPVEPPPATFDDAVDQLRERFETAVERQAGGRQEHAVLLGGLDSALVAAALRRLGHEVATYTFSFGDPRYEQRNAAAFAREIGADHHPVPIEPDAVMDRLERFGDLFPGIGAQPHYQIHTLLGCEQLAADGFDHVYTGDGCDSIFLGYPTVSARAGVMQRLGSIPTPAARAAARVLATDIAERRLGHLARTARGLLRNLEHDMPVRGHLPTRYLDDAALGRLRPDRPIQAESVAAIRGRLAAGHEDLDPVRLAFHGNGLNRQSQAKVDGAVRATGVVQSSPFRDPGVRDFVTGLPTAFLRPDGGAPRDAGKAVLVEMIRRHRLLPESIVTMPKQSPSDSPIDGWYAGVLRSRVERLLTELPFHIDREALDDLLRPKLAERLYRERVSISHHAFQAVGILASYAAFTRRG